MRLVDGSKIEHEPQGSMRISLGASLEKAAPNPRKLARSSIHIPNRDYSLDFNHYASFQTKLAG